MITKPKSIIFLFISLLVLVYGLSFLVNILLGFNEKWQDASNTFNQVYLFFAMSSLLLFIIHFIVYKKNKDQLGFVFLITLTLKVAVSFLFVKEIINVFEKYYIIIYFFVFLIIDVWLTVGLLNKNNETKSI